MDDIIIQAFVASALYSALGLDDPIQEEILRVAKKVPGLEQAAERAGTVNWNLMAERARREATKLLEMLEAAA